MDRNRPLGFFAGHDSNMYDDRSHSSSPSNGYHNFRKENQRTPPRGPAGDRTYDEERSRRGDRYDYENSYERSYERSRSPQREGRGRYTDRDREGYQSPSDSSRSRSPYFGAPPNRTVILEGLSVNMTQEDILNELQHSLRVENIEEVRLIKDKRTGQSRQFAFAQFASVPDARRFLERYYPTISLSGPYDPNQAVYSEPSKVRIAYSREKDEWDRPGKNEDDWKCEVCSLSNFAHRILCFRCNAPRTRATAHGVVVAQTNMSPFSGLATTGDSDASPDGTASQFLLLRGLESGVNEELLAKGVSKLYKTKSGGPSTDVQGTKKKMASTSNDASLGAKDGSLRRVLLIRDRKTNDSWRYGFAEFNTVEDAQAAFAKYNASDRWTISSKPVLISYIHAGVFVPVLHFLDADSARFTFSPLSNSAAKLMYWDEAAYASEFVTATAQQLPPATTKKNEHAKLATAAGREGLAATGTEGEPKSKKRKVERETSVASKKVVAPHLQFWTNQHAELHGLPAKDDKAPSSDGTPTALEKRRSQSPPAQSFADLDRKCCILCSRQFKTEAEVNKHERMSQLHRDNMKMEDLVAKALVKLNKPLDQDADSAVYRDRAKERRQAFNQPKQPPTQHNKGSKDSNKPQAPQTDEDPPVPTQSKGAALLGKMGWTAGEGLGAQGTGRTEAITTDLYTQGVGLGAKGGRIGDATEEAHRQTKGSYADFVNMAKNKAKERFESLR